MPGTKASTGFGILADRNVSSAAGVQKVCLQSPISSTKDKFTEFTLDPPFAPKVRGKKASIVVAVDSYGRHAVGAEFLL